MFSINVILWRVSVGAVGWSEWRWGLGVSRIAGSAHGSGLPTLLEPVALPVHLKDVNGESETVQQGAGECVSAH